MEFGKEKCAVLGIKSGKRHITEGVEPSKQVIRKLGERETYKYLGTMESDPIKQADMKEKNLKEYLRITRKSLATNLYSRNLVRVLNSKAVPLVTYSGSFLKWTMEELKRMAQRTKTYDYACGPMLVTEPNVVWLLVTVVAAILWLPY